MQARYTHRSWHGWLLLLVLLATTTLFDQEARTIFGFEHASAAQQSAGPAADLASVPVELLQAVLPAADSFSYKAGQPPVIKAYRTDPESAERQLLGYVFLTSDLPRAVNGFSAPIEVLVGMDLEARITAVKVLHYVESIRTLWGDFLATPGYQEQFAGKHVSEPFRVGKDIDGMARATITFRAMSKGIRNSARRVARAYL